ncbi:MAG: hypothetical protein P4L33_09210 [Capsulimonadaceae bacterium]|nr:hypothetical protein [Capsulimonadaceae bacterium]
MTRIFVVAALLGFAALALDASFAHASPLTRKAFSVADFGATPNTDADSGPAIRKAIAAAVASGQPADVVFGGGVYTIKSIPDHVWWERYAIMVDGAKDLRLLGRPKTTLVIADPWAGAIDLENCLHVVAQDLTIDYDPVPQVTGTIVSVDPDGGFIEVEDAPADPDMMSIGDPVLGQPGKKFYSFNYQRASDGSPIWGIEGVDLERAEQTGPHRWKLAVTQKPTFTRRDGIHIAGLKAGDLFMASSFAYVGHALNMANNKYVEARRITVHAAPGMAFVPVSNDEVRIVDCIMEIKPGSRRVLSADSDGIHGVCNRRIVIEGCSLAGNGDDTINLHASAIGAISRTAQNALVFRRGWNRFSYPPRVGDTIEQVRPVTRHVIGKYVVKSVDDTQKDGCHVVFLQDAPDVEFAATRNAGDQFFNLNESNPDCMIRGNTFGTHRGRDVLLQSIGGVVENNRFVKRLSELNPPVVSTDPGFHKAMMWLMGASVVVGFDPSWREGPIAEGLTIRDNEFVGSEYRAPAILLGNADGGIQATTYNNFTVAGNRFINRSAPAVVARHVAGLTIKNNKVTGRAENQAGTSGDPVFDLKGCAPPQLSGNKVEDGLYGKLVETTP